jgi:hypothetical protein
MITESGNRHATPLDSRFRGNDRVSEAVGVGLCDLRGRKSGSPGIAVKRIVSVVVRQWSD